MKRKQLTYDQAQEIRRLYATGEYKQYQIAEQYGVLTKSISQICNNETLTSPTRKPRGPTLEKGPVYKGLAIYTPVLTDSGWKLAQDLTLEDKLVAVDGQYTNITELYTDSERPMMRVHFEDQLWVDTGADHRWSTLDQKSGYGNSKAAGWKVKTSQRLMEVTSELMIPTCAATPGEVFIGKDPYAIGLLLGDGSTVPNISYATLYNQDEYILNHMIENHHWRRYDYKDCVPRVVAPSVEASREWKKAVGTAKAHFKKVPAGWMTASPKQRLAVLQGLLDTDGCADKDGRISFCSVSYELALNVCALVRSLGGKARETLCEREEKTSLGGGRYYDVRVTPCNKFIPFRLPRKIARCKHMKGVNMRVKGSEWVLPSRSVGITIDHPSHQFIIKDYLVAHDVTGFPSCRKLPAKSDATART